MSVFIFHCTVLADVDPKTLGLVDLVWRHLTFLNGLGPLLFFALSGFLITSILLKTKEREGYFRNFYIRRGLRILPLYYAVVIFSLLVLPQAPAFLGWLQPKSGGVLPENIAAIASVKVDNFAGKIGDTGWTYWLLLHNWAIAAQGTFRHGILDVTWSVAVEEQFFLFWPAIVLLCSRRALIRWCIGLFVFAFLFRSALVYVFDANPIAVYVLTPARLGAPALGCLAAIVWQDKELVRRLAHPCAIIAALTIPAVWTINALEIFMKWDFEGEYGIRGGPIGRTFGDSLVAVGMFSLVLTCANAHIGSLFQRIMASRVLGVIAKYSYGIFLFHLPIRAVIRDLIFGPGAKGNPKFLFFDVAGSYVPAQLLFYVVAFVPTFILAYLSWHLFEKHFVDLKERFAPRPATSAAKNAASA